MIWSILFWVFPATVFWLAWRVLRRWGAEIAADSGATAGGCFVLTGIFVALLVVAIYLLGAAMMGVAS